jgi:hypothetical protein
VRGPRLPHGELKPTAIALIVAEGDRHRVHAEKFVSGLPDTTILTVYAAWNVRQRLKSIASERDVPCDYAESPGAAVRNVQIAILIGPSPFGDDDHRTLEQQGIVVEHRDLESGRARPRRNGA